MDRYDILSSDDVLQVVDNDFVYGVSDTQHVQDTINAAPGWWKENFADGVNIRNFLGSAGQEQIAARKVKMELESDLYECLPAVQFGADGKLNITPNATI